MQSASGQQDAWNTVSGSDSDAHCQNLVLLIYLYTMNTIENIWASAPNSEVYVVQSFEMTKGLHISVSPFKNNSQRLKYSVDVNPGSEDENMPWEYPMLI